MKSGVIAFVLSVATLVATAASEISVSLRLDNVDFVAGERVRGVIEVVNVTPGKLSVGYRDSHDRLFVEVFRSGDKSQLESVSSRSFVSPFFLESCKGLKLETYLGDHYGLRTPGQYLARPVLVHRGSRFEGQMRAFTIVPGMRIGGAMQIFSNYYDMQREFDLVTWNRGGEEHLFVSAHDDEGYGRNRKWRTTDLGPMMKVTKPTIAVMPTGEVVILHRIDPDNFVRSEFWSVPGEIIFHARELVQDPETAGTARVREMYKESGGIKPKENPWWKFW